MSSFTSIMNEENTNLSEHVSDNDDIPNYTTLTNVALPDTLSPWQNGQGDSAVRENDDFEWGDTQATFHTGNSVQNTSAVDNYIAELENIKNQPRSIVIDHIRKMTRDNIPDLEMIRTDLYQKAVLRDDFPVKDGYLRRRIETRKLGQVVPASLQKKLSKDCFTLLLACNGEYSDDIAEVVPTKKQRSGSVIGTNSKLQSQPDDVAGVQILTETVTIIQREILSMKSAYTEQIDELKNTMNKIMKEKESAQTRAKKFQAEIKTLKHQLENCVKENETVKQKLEEVETETHQKIEKLIKENNKLEINVNNNKEDINEQSSAIQKLSVNTEKKLNVVKSGISETKEKISDCLNVAQRYDNEQQNGVASLKYQIRLTNQKMKQRETEYKDLDEEMEKLKSSTSTLQKQQTDLKKMILKNYRDVKRTSTTQEKSNETVSTKPTLNLSNRFQVLHNTNNDETESETEETTNKRTNEEPKPIQAHYSSCLQGHSQGKSTASKTKVIPDEKPKPIQVHCPSSVCNMQYGEFCGFKPVTRRKVQRFYVHGINKVTSSEKLMRQYLERKNVKVTCLRYFERDYKRTASAQLNVIDDGDCLVGNRSFWPDGIYVRPWLPREVFLTENGHN
ncbi:putative leucine-rich repeat-containing protein DDB_G0290503 [Argopecten irradians]|uniref:putative leucine-rich repeat-containing protein DDB_G0290503 n=1 Tax=Argopecten irradians TaxID=31199 RepID=UPI00371D88F4